MSWSPGAHFLRVAFSVVCLVAVAVLIFASCSISSVDSDSPEAACERIQDAQAADSCRVKLAEKRIAEPCVRPRSLLVPRDAKLAESEYMYLDDETPVGQRTFVFAVRSKRSQDYLGWIKWWGAWRQYTFHPVGATVFNVGCLEDIAGWIQELMNARFEDRRARA